MAYNNISSSPTSMTTVETSSTHNVTVEEINSEERRWFLPVLVIYVFLMIVGIVGNIFVLIIYKLKFKRSSARIYILCLALTDLSVCLVGIPYHVLDLTLLLTYTYTNLCKVLSFLIGSCTLSSIFVLLVVGLDRFLKVCYPLKRQIVDFGDRRACIIAIVVAVVISIPNAILYGQSSVETDIAGLTGVECFIDDYYQNDIFGIAYLGFNLLVFILSVAFLMVIYGLICRKIYKSAQGGEISVQSKKKLCNCKSPDTDSVDSYEMEQTMSQNDTMHTFAISSQSVDQSPEATRKALITEGSGQVNNEEVHEMKAVENDVKEEIKSNEDSKDCVEQADSVVNKGNDQSKDTSGKSVHARVDGDKDTNECKVPPEGSDAAAVTGEKENKDNASEEKVALLKSEKTVQKAEPEPAATKSVNITTPTASEKGVQKLQPVRSDTMMRHGMKKEKHTRKITLMMLTITVVFILSYLPFIVISLLDGIFEGYWSDMSKEQSILIDFLLRLYIINNVANPIIYSFWDNRFRGECKALIRKLLCCGSKKQKRPTFGLK